MNLPFSVNQLWEGLSCPPRPAAHTPSQHVPPRREGCVVSQVPIHSKCSVSALCGCSLDGWSHVSALALLSHGLRESETREFLSVPQNNCHRTGRKGCLLTISTSVTQKGLGSGTDSKQGLRTRHRRERNPERPPCSPCSLSV